MRLKENNRRSIRYWFTTTVISCSVFAVLCFTDISLASIADSMNMKGGNKKTCSTVAKAAFRAAKHEIKDDYWISYGKCQNLSDQTENTRCRKAARSEFAENKDLVRDQLQARLELCFYLGEEPYAPVIDPANFIDFGAVVNGDISFVPQPYYPLVPGMVRTYIVKNQDGEDLEFLKVEVLAETKEILGINCIVIRDQVWEYDEEGELVLLEDTDDWYAQDLQGNVWYFGEIAKNYEDGELVDVEGSWQAGKEYDMPGMIMLSTPQEGELYRQEFSLGNAEDMGQIDGFMASLSVGGITYPNVLRTVDFTPIEPGVEELKYYAPGIGVIKEENPEDGEVLELVEVINP